MADKEVKTAGEKFGAFLEKNKKGVAALLIVVLVLIAAFVIFEVVYSKNTEKNLSAVEAISYELTDGAAALEDSELTARMDSALEKLASYTNKGGVAGVRANLLAAEIEYQKKNYESAAAYWDAAASKGKKSYTAPLAYYNKASCLEENGDLDGAAAAYKLAADNENFILASHAKFSYGRVLEAKGDYAGAVQAYKELNDSDPDDSWANLAKSRIIALQNEGKAE